MRGNRKNNVKRTTTLTSMESLETRVLISAGDLDASFGTAGRVRTAFSTQASGQAATTTPDGKIVEAGEVTTPSGIVFGVARYNADGSADAGFGAGGVVTFPFAGGGATAVAVQSNGQILAGGSVSDPDGNGTDFGIVRLNVDGTLDTTFGTGGHVFTNFGQGMAGVRKLAVQPNGRIVALGTIRTGAHNTHLAVARYTAAGVPDATFGAGGSVSLSFQNGSATETDNAAGLSLLPDGHLLVAGTSGAIDVTAKAVVYDTAVARLNADGSLDATFGTNGVVTAFHNAFQPSDLAVKTDGSLLLGGTAKTPAGHQGGVAELNADGSVRTVFGTDGVAVVDGMSAVAAVAQGRLGQILAAGSDGTNFALARLNLDGSADASFGNNGVAAAGFGDQTTFANSIIFQPDGGVVVSGVTFADSATTAQAAAEPSDFLLAKFQGDGVPLAAAEVRPFAVLNNNGRLDVVGTGGSDVIAFKRGPAGTGTILATLNGRTETFLKSQVKRIRVKAGFGDTRITLCNHLPRTRVFAGQGMDTLTVGQNAPQTLGGGAANDVLVPRS